MPFPFLATLVVDDDVLGMKLSSSRSFVSFFYRQPPFTSPMTVKSSQFVKFPFTDTKVTTTSYPSLFLSLSLSITLQIRRQKQVSKIQTSNHLRHENKMWSIWLGSKKKKRRSNLVSIHNVCHLPRSLTVWFLHVSSFMV